MTTAYKVVLTHRGDKLVLEIPRELQTTAGWVAGMPLFLHRLDEQSVWLSTRDDSELVAELESLLGQMASSAKEAHRAVSHTPPQD